MKLTRSAAIPPGPLGLVALINVVLLLMFFFLLGSSFVLQPGIAVTLPISKFSLPPQIDAQIVTLQPGPPARVYYQDHAVSLPELGRRLAAFRGSPRSVVLRAGKDTPYDLVVAVMNQALEQGYAVALATTPPHEKS